MLKNILCLLLAVMISFTTSANAKSYTLQLDGDHGKLSAILQTPEGQNNYPLVLLFHGFTGSKHSPLLTSLANNLETKGIASLRFDFNGHGESEGNFSDMTILNEIGDAQKVYAYVAKLPSVTSISIAGHSQGGVVASMLAGQLGTDKIKAIALMAPASVLRDDAIRGNLFGIYFDPINPPEYVELFDNHKIGRNYILNAQTLQIYETAEKSKGPALMIHGTGDRTVPYTCSLHYQHIYQNSRLELLPKFDHVFSKDVEKTTQIVAEFFEKRLNKI